MSEATPVRVPQETVNDDYVLVQSWRVRDGEIVSTGQILVEVETSKSVFEIASPSDGIVRWNAQAGSEVPIGHILCYVGGLHAADEQLVEREPSIDPPESKLLMPLRVESPAAHLDSGTTPGDEDRLRSLEVRSNARRRFSHAALAKLAESGLSADDVEGTGLVRRRDLDGRKQDTPNEETNSSLPIPPGRRERGGGRSVVGVPYETSSLSRSKRLESKILAWNYEPAIPSEVSVQIPTLGRTIWQEIDAALPDHMTGEMIQAVGRLLLEYRHLNACCIDDEVRLYQQINIGYALDAGDGLKVGVIPHVDQLDVAQVVARRAELLERYLGRKLEHSDLAGGTFTITDLSGAGVSSFAPLISEGQAAILGIGAETAAPLAGRQYCLTLAFDHRLVEGRVAARFLNQLKDHMLRVEQLMRERYAEQLRMTEPRCARCRMTLSQSLSRKHHLVQVAAADWSVEWLCTVCLQGR